MCLRVLGLEQRRGVAGGKGGGENTHDGDAVMEEAAGEEEGDGEDSKTGVRCSRCTKKGHVASRCTVDLYCVICDGHDHVNHKCPIFKHPRPVAHAIGYAVHGLGFYHITLPPLSRGQEGIKNGVVQGGW